MSKTGFVHCVDAFAFLNNWDMQPGDWDQLRGLIQGAVTEDQVVPNRISSMVWRVLLLIWTSSQSKTKSLQNGGPTTDQLPGSSRSIGSSGP